MQPLVDTIPLLGGSFRDPYILKYTYNIIKGDVTMSISEKIQQLRKSNGLSQEQLAEKLDVSRQAISKWESGTSFPDVEKIVLISELFEVSTDYLIKDKYVSKYEEIAQQYIQVSRKLYIVDINKRKLSAFDEFVIEMLSASNKGEGTLITGITKSNTKVKIPVCVLYGVTKGVLGMNKHTTLGFYASLEDAEKELNNISKASVTETVYELKYAAKMQGVRITDG